MRVFFQKTELLVLLAILHNPQKNHPHPPYPLVTWSIDQKVNSVRPAASLSQIPRQPKFGKRLVNLTNAV